MDCPERDRLWSEYNLSLDLLTSTVEELEQPFNAATFGPRLMAAKGAKDLCKAARQVWEIHLRDHQCGGPPISN